MTKLRDLFLSIFKGETIMSTTRVIFGLTLLPLLAGVALAEPLKQSSNASARQPLALSDQQKSRPAKQPMQLNEKQMDGVTAGMAGFGLPPGTIIYIGGLPSDPINTLWPNPFPNCHIGACL
jgi:hypothetical protein